MKVANATPGTGALASIYAVDSTASPIAGSVVTTDATGTFNFYAPDGRYDLVVGFGVSSKTVADIEISDITESQSGDATAKFGTLNFTTAFQHNGTPFAAADLSDGNSGTGAIAHVTSPVFVTPTLGAATATSITGAGGLNIGTPAWAGTLNVQAQDGTNEGGELHLVGAAANTTVILDNQSGNFRIFGGAANPITVNLATGTLSLPGTLSIPTTSNTLPATIANDTAGGIVATNNAGKQVRLVDAGGAIYVGQGSGVGILFFGATSGNTTVQAPAIAGTPVLVWPTTSGNIVADSATQTLTNKRISPRVVTVTNATTLTPDGDNSDVSAQVNTQAGGTLTIAAPTGTPTDGQKLIIRVKSTNAQTYSFNATYAFSTSVTAPTTLAAGKTDYIGLMWNATNTKWDVVAVDQGH